MDSLKYWLMYIPTKQKKNESRNLESKWKTVSQDTTEQYNSTQKWKLIKKIVLNCYS